MRFSEVCAIVHGIDDASYSPSRSEVRFGCDCGCGGDSYTAESWDAEEADALQAIKEAKEFCTEFGIEYDGIE